MMTYEPMIVRHDVDGDTPMTLIAQDQLEQLHAIIGIGLVLATLAERPGGQDIEFDGSRYMAVKPEVLDELADIGTEFRQKTDQWLRSRAKQAKEVKP